MAVRPGLEVLLDEGAPLLRGRRAGLLCHPASVDTRLRHAVDLLAAQPGVTLGAIFGPQHGLHGQTQDNMIEWEGFRHPVLGVPVRSLYGEVRKPRREWLDGLDVLVVDLQDVGTRIYTFSSTLFLALEACAEAGIPVVVADRPNPIGGTRVEGPLLEEGFTSFVGMLPGVPTRHGLTLGELALSYRAWKRLNVEIEVVKADGWTRTQVFEDTGLPWVLPSPNMPSADTALVFPGTVHLEGTNASEGRGTTRPFEIVGAPYVDAERLAGALRSEKLPGVFFRPHSFEPTFQKHARTLCGGVQIHVTDPGAFAPVRTGYAVCRALRALAGDAFRWSEGPYEYVTDRMPIDVIAGTATWRDSVDALLPSAEAEDRWRAGEEAFREARRPFLLYQ